MISVILSILKVILIILACILGFLLLILCLFLFVPIRYELYGESDEKISAKIRISWLLRIVSLRIFYIEEELSMKFRIFAIPMDRFTKKDSNKDERKNKQRKKNKNNNRSKNKSVLKEPIKQPVKTHKLDKPEKPDKPKEVIKEKQSMFSKICEKLKHIWKLIIKIFNTIKSILIKIYNFLLNIDSDEEESKNNFKKIKEFIKENKLGIERIIKAIKELLKHIIPRKFTGYAEFGTGDPSSTGQALGIISIFYGIYSDNIRLVPNFEDKILKGNVLLKGRIRLFTIVIIMVKLLIDRSFRILWKNYNVLKEEL